MRARQPNLGSGARRLAALSCGLGLCGLVLTACGITGLPGGLLGTSFDGQRSDAGVIGGGTAGRSVPGTTPVSTPPPVRPPTAPTPAGRTAPPPMSFDAGVAGDGGFPIDGGFPGLPDGGVIGIDAGISCSEGFYPGDLSLYDKPGLMMIRGCKRIAGSLTIYGDFTEDLSDLRDLTTVDGALQIFGGGFGSGGSTPLKSLKGLENLRKVGSLSLQSLTDLPNLEPLSELTSASEVLITGMSVLTNLNGLGRLTNQNTLRISDNPQLQSLGGLQVPEAVSQIDLSNNPMLADVQSLMPLRKVGLLMLAQLPALKSLAGLQNLQPGYEHLTITECNALTDLTSLGAYGRTTEIVGNAELRALATTTSAQQLQVIALGNNPKLESLAGIVAAEPQTPQSIILERLPSLKSLADLKTLQKVDGLGISTCDGLKDLTGLEALASAQSLQLLDCAGLQSLKGLNALQRIELGFYLDAMTSLTSLQGMPALQFVGNLAIINNNSLPNLQGLDQLTALGEVEVSSNLALNSLHGLEKVTEINSLNLIGNTALPNLTGLAGLQRVNVLQLSGNPGLKSLQGIALRSAQTLAIDSNPVLADLTGLENLTSIPSNLSIVQNASLTSLRALGMLTSVGGLFIQENRRLPQCEVEWLAKRVSQPATSPNGPPGMCAP